MRKFVSGARLLTIQARQEPDKWGPRYEPAIRATREEAPRVSRPSIYQSPLLQRGVHFMSSAELHIGCLAFLHPRLFDLQEQRMLSIRGACHPLHGRPEGTGLDLPPFKGTADVAERLGRLDLHPMFSHRASDGWSRVPFCLTGDLLLFLRDDEGPYCKNWNCKDRKSSFGRRRPDDPVPRNAQRARELALFRKEVEHLYYADAHISTSDCAEEDIPKELRNTARDLATWALRTHAYSEAHRLEIVGAFRDALRRGLTPNEVIGRLTRGSKQHEEAHRVVLYQAIQKRELRVDLFQPILPDFHLLPEKRDVLVEFADWFAR